MEVPHTTGVPAALIRLAQGTLVTEERASLVFLQAVHSFVASGRAVLHNLEGGTPDVTPSQVLIGGVDRTGTYLMTPTTYDLVCAYKRRAGQVGCSSCWAVFSHP